MDAFLERVVGQRRDEQRAAQLRREKAESRRRAREVRLRRNHRPVVVVVAGCPGAGPW